MYTLGSVHFRNIDISGFCTYPRNEIKDFIYSQQTGGRDRNYFQFEGPQVHNILRSQVELGMAYYMKISDC